MSNLFNGLLERLDKKYANVLRDRLGRRKHWEKTDDKDTGSPLGELMKSRVIGYLREIRYQYRFKKYTFPDDIGVSLGETEDKSRSSSCKSTLFHDHFSQFVTIIPLPSECYMNGSHCLSPRKMMSCPMFLLCSCSIWTVFVRSRYHSSQCDLFRLQ